MVVERFDTVLHNGSIVVDAKEARLVEAIGISRGRVKKIGSAEDFRNLDSCAETVINLNGRTVVPGLIDSHIHFVRAGSSWLEELRVGNVRSIDQLLGSIREKAKSPSQAGWVAVVGGWSPGQLKEGRFPTLKELDDAAPDVPVYMQYAYDRAMVNSAAMKQASLSDQTQLGSGIERDAQGNPTGMLYGKAAYAYCLGFALKNDYARKIEGTTAMFRDLAAFGLTGGVDTGGGARMGPEAYRPMMEVARRGDMTFKGRLFVHPHGADEIAELEEYLRQLHPGFGNSRIKYVGIGEILIHDCYDGAGIDKNFAIGAETKELLYEATMKCAELGWAVSVHGVHDQTISTILDVWERVDRVHRIADLRFSISHGDGASIETLQRIRALGAGITVQDRLTIRMVETAASWGEAQAQEAPPLRDMLELGIPIGGGTDATVAAPVNPWLALHYFITGIAVDNGVRRAARHRLSRLEALDIYTSGSAWFSFEEETRGKLLPGYEADLAVLSADFLTVEEDQIEHISSVLTMVDGNVVFRNDSVYPDAN